MENKFDNFKLYSIKGLIISILKLLKYKKKRNAIKQTMYIKLIELLYPVKFTKYCTVVAHVLMNDK